jgi:glycosyltransferase involved in cell wall biosynthesis
MNSAADPDLRVSVIVCTHNPRRAHLTAALEALRVQTLDRKQWELVIVDNVSAEPVAGWLDASWHPNARIIREEELGLTRARLRGLSAAQAALLVFVDDDNVLASDYLATALGLAERHAMLGIWSGRVDLEFAKPPPEWTRKYWPFLVHRPIERESVSQALRLEEPLPVGAGMCLRREVATAYSAAAPSSSLRLNLDRRGLDLASAGDTEMALFACANGWQRGVFPQLRLRHLIPPERATEDYLVRLTEGILFSSFVVKLLHQINAVPPPIDCWWRLKCACDLATKFGRRRRFYLASKNAQRRSRKLYEEVVLGAARSAPAPKPDVTPDAAADADSSG